MASKILGDTGDSTDAAVDTPGPGNNRPGDGPGSQGRTALPPLSLTNTATGKAGAGDRVGLGPTLLLKPDGSLGAWQREDDLGFPGSSPKISADFPSLGVLSVDEKGNVEILESDVLDASITAAQARGEAPAALDNDEFNALLAAGLITDGAGNPIPAEDVEDWRAALVGRAILAPAAWVPYLKGTGAESPVTLTAPETAAPAPSGAASPSDDWSGGRRSSGGGGYTRSYGGGGGGYGGGGYGGGGGGDWSPGTFPQSARDFLGPDFMDGFMDDFAFGDVGDAEWMSGSPSTSGSRRRGRSSSSRLRRGRGRSGRTMRTPRMRSTPTSSRADASSAAPSGLPAGMPPMNANAEEALLAALALKGRS